MKWRIRWARALAALVLAALSAGLLPAVDIDPQRYLAHVKYLASEELRGRGLGMDELDKAAAYIAAQFQQAGLAPLNGGSYYQPLEVTTSAKLGTGNVFRYQISGAAKQLELGKDFLPFNSSSVGTVSGSIVFAGYGITANEYNYDDYAGVDVKDKIVLVLRHEPQEFDEKSVFAGKVFTQHSQFFAKATNAKMHGAKAVVLVNDTHAHGGAADELEKFGSTAGPKDAGIPFVQITSATAKAWFQAAGKDFDEIQKDIDADLKPRSFAFPESISLTLTVDLERQLRTVNNVVGYLAGESDEYVVIGAHYDHLGLGEQFSMAPSQVGTPHPGADDNASGTAGLIELAHWFGKQRERKRGLLFLAFAAEEHGLLGSAHYVKNPYLPLERAVAMLNMDMIGRVRDGKVYIGGKGTGTTFASLLDEVVKGSGLNVDFSDSTGYGSSDHASFTTREVPVLFFFSGLHGDYHRPSDTWEKITAEPAAKLVSLVGRVAEKLAGEPQRPQFVRVAPPPGAHGVAGQATGSGYGAYFGSIPDFTELPKGVRFSDVRPESPAEKAGLKAGDVLIEFDGKPIGNLYDFTYALRAAKPGDVVKVKFLRNDEEREATVTLERRK